MNTSCKNFFLCSSGRVTLQVLTATLLVVTEVNFDLKLALYTSPKLPENELNEKVK